MVEKLYHYTYLSWFIFPFGGFQVVSNVFSVFNIHDGKQRACIVVGMCLIIFLELFHEGGIAGTKGIHYHS